MYPPKLPLEKKRNWSHSDSFLQTEESVIRQFVHKNYSIGMHTHSFYELNIVLRGEGRHYIQNASVPAVPGCVFVIPTGIAHGYYNMASLDVYHMLLHRDFFPSLPRQLTESFGYSALFEIEPQMRQMTGDNLFLRLSDTQMEEVQLLIELITRYTENNTFAVIGAQNLILYLSSVMAESFGLKATGSEKKTLPPIAKCLRFMHLNFEQKITVETLSKMACMSRSTFLRQFEKMCGCTPSVYLNRLRLHKFEELLLLGKNKTEAALACGFYDASHMYKTKKKVSG